MIKERHRRKNWGNQIGTLHSGRRNGHGIGRLKQASGGAVIGGCEVVGWRWKMGLQ